MSPALHMCLNPSQHYVVGATARHAGGTYVYDDGRWRHWGADDPSLTAVAFDRAGTVWTTGQNGLWRSVDGGRRWRIMTDWRITDARALALDPARPGSIHLGLPDGVAYSADHGLTWERRHDGLPENGRYCQTVAVDRTHAGHVVAGCERGVVVSADGGSRWWLRVPTRTTVTQVVQSDSSWFAATESEGLWRSLDGARHWHRVSLPSTGTLYDVVVDPAVRGAVAVVDHVRGVWWSEDDGDTWTCLTDALEQPLRAHRLGIDPRTGHLVLATYTRGLLVSPDRGRSWSEAGWQGSDVRSFTIGEPR